MTLRSRHSAALATAMLLGAAVPAAADRLDLEYDVYVGGIRAITIDASIDLEGNVAEPGHYNLTAEAKTVQLLAHAYPYKLEARLSGERDAAGISPASFQYTAQTRKRLQTVQMVYAANGEVSLTAKRQKGDKTSDMRPEVPAEQWRDTLDPGSALVAAARAVAATGQCGGTVPVFDGRRRYDVTFTAAGVEELQESRYSSFSGRAVKCSAEVKQLSGFSKDTTPKERVPAQAMVWIGPAVPGGPPVPVRIEASIKLGELRVHLSDASMQKS